jgi:urease accessory protein
LAELHHIQNKMSHGVLGMPWVLLFYGGPDMTRMITLSLSFLLASVGNAFGHHPLGGTVPETMLHGLLSGFGHPVIGFDHLAFVLAIGVLAAFQSRRLLIPFGFVIGTVIGTFLTLAAVTLPYAELVITLSVLFAGIAVMRGKTMAALPVAILISLAGLFHGWAYGAAIVGAELTPLIAYLFGFGSIQLALMLGAGFVIRKIWRATSMAELQPRLAGALLTGVGLTYLVEHVEGFLFAGM